MENSSKTKKVILIGLDGCRPDCCLAAKTPNIKKIAEQNYYSWNAQSEIHTISGPAWTSSLTGVHMDKHKVTDNDFKPFNRKYETIFKIAKKIFPKIRTVAHSHWGPIVTELFEPNSMDIKCTGSDKKMMKNIVKDIQKDKGDLYFIQMDDIDGAGHKHTYSLESKKYLECIEERDKMVGEILKAIENRSNTEDWLVIIYSDHGGEGKGHGLPVKGCLNVVFIVANKNLTKRGEMPYNLEEEEYPQLVDIVPTIAEFLNIPKNPEWDGNSRF